MVERAMEAVDIAVAHLEMGDHSFPRHTHEDWSFAVLHSGRAFIRTHRGHETIGPGTGTVLHPDQCHWGNTVTARYDAVLIRPALVARLLSSGDSPTFQAVAFPATPVRHVLAALTTAPPATEEQRERVTTAIVDLFAHATPRCPEPPRALVQSLRQRLDAHIDREISLQHLAREYGVAAATLIRGFRREMGISPYSYLLSRRVDFARRLLTGGMRPAEAARHSGFYDQAHLTRHFRRQVGITPARYSSLVHRTRGQRERT
jgi:AraC-like DNA-binding protein